MHHYKYLEGFVCNSVGADPAIAAVTSELRTKVQSLSAVPLQFIHRIDLVRMTLIPLLTHRLQFLVAAQQTLDTMDDIMRNFVKHAHDTPANCPRSVLCAARGPGFQFHKLKWALHSHTGT